MEVFQRCRRDRWVLWMEGDICPTSLVTAVSVSSGRATSLEYFFCKYLCQRKNWSARGRSRTNVAISKSEWRWWLANTSFVSGGLCGLCEGPCGSMRSSSTSISGCGTSIKTLAGSALCRYAVERTLRAKGGWEVDILSKVGPERLRAGGKNTAVSLKFVRMMDGADALYSRALESTYSTWEETSPLEWNKSSGYWRKC